MASSIPLPDNIAQYFERAVSEGDRTGSVRTLPYDYEVLGEHLLDPSHPPFAHHGSVPGLTRSNAGATTMKPVAPVTPNAIVSVEFTNANFGAQRSPFLEFVNPALIKYTYKSQDPAKSKSSIMLTIVPVRKGQSRVFTRFLPEGVLTGHNPEKSIARRLRLLVPVISHFANNNILDGDTLFLHLQGQNLRKERKNGWTPDTFFTPMSADYMILRFRNWLRKEGGGGPFGPSDIQETSPTSRRQLLDRYESWTLLTKDAQKTLAFVNKMAAVCDFVSRASLVVVGACLIRGMHNGILYRWQTLAGLVVSALFFSVGRYLREKIVPRFYFVDYVHADKN